jgi:hypothetical protein
MNDAISRKNSRVSNCCMQFIQNNRKRKVNKNYVNLQCDLQHPQQTNWDLGQISCNNMSSLMLIKGIKERLMMMDLVTQMDKVPFIYYVSTIWDFFDTLPKEFCNRGRGLSAAI